MRIILLFLTLLLVEKVHGQSNIKVGESAPIINITHWVKNEPSDKNLSDKFIVLEFWATWCGPCIAAVPHMNEIQKKYGQNNLYFISLTDESVEKIERTLKRIDFHSIVATDVTKKTMIDFGNGKDGLDAYPLTVLIDNKGIIRWIGEPKNLDSKVMDDFLQDETKNVTVLQNENNSKSEENAILDFRTLLSDKSINYHFSMNETSHRETVQLAMGNSLMELKAHKLEDIYTGIFEITNIDLPENLSSTYFNLLYKTGDKVDPLGKLESEILTQLNLTKTIEKRPSKSYAISVVDAGNLDKTLESKFSSKSDAGDKIIFTAYTLPDMLDELTKVHNVEFAYQEQGSAKYDFIIDINSIEETLQSLASYGLMYKIQDSYIEHIILSY